jgi:putative ABC transport system permease protein
MTNLHTGPFRWLEDARRDLRYALRTLGRAPGFTLVAVLTLALGIGAVTLIYSVLYNVLLDPLPYRDSDRLVNVMVRDSGTGRARNVLPASEFLDFKEQSTVFEEVIGTGHVTVRYATADLTDYLHGVWVTPNFFEFMGLPPLIGRTITPADGRPDAPAVAVLRHRAWISHFNADPNVVGRAVTMNGEPRTIIGVMPPRFTWHGADLWMPSPIERTNRDAGGMPRNFQARLKPGVGLEQAEAQLALIAARRAQQHPAEYPANFTVRVVNVIAYTVGPFSTVLYTMLAAVGLLMLIACCNVANMLLARATTREREMTVRAALGAGRGRIVRQLLVESLVLAIAGAVGGCLLAYAGIDALVALLPPGPLPGEIDIRLNGPVLAFSLGAAVVCALVFGVAPALYSARRDLVQGLKGAGKGTAGGQGRLRSTLVSAEIALSLVLLLGAGLLVRSFVSLTRVDLGFDPVNLLLAPVAFPQGQPAAEKHRFYQRAIERISALPGVVAAAASASLPPVGGGMDARVDIPGRPADPQRTAMVQWCTDGYFRALELPLIRGQGLPAFGGNDAARVVVVNRRLAFEYFAGEDPVGQHIAFRPLRGGGGAYEGSFEIVGVVEDVRNRGLQERPAPQAYLTGAPGNSNPLFIVRTAADPMLSLNLIKREMAAVDRQAVLVQPTRVEDALDRWLYSQPRFSLVVLGLFGATGTLLVAIGVFSVMAYTVSRQTREIAVRMALGADRRHVSRVVLRLAAVPVTAGVIVGALASFATSRLIANQLWNTSPHDPLTIAVAIGTIVLVAMAACYIPARRAMRIEPMTALRHD